MANNYTLGKGKIYFDPFTTGTTTKTGERYLGNCPSFELSVDSETLEHFSSESGIQEKDAEVILRIIRSGTIQCDNMSEDNVALFIIGTSSTVTQTATPVADEPISAVLQGRYYQLGVSASNPSGVKGVSSVTVTGSGGTPTYTVTTDYTLDANMGQIYIVPGGGISDSTNIEVDYTPNANSRTQVESASLTATEGCLRFVSDNPQGTNRDYYGPKVKMKPTGAYQLIGEEWMTMTFEVEFTKLDTNTEALYVDGRPA